VDYVHLISAAGIGGIIGSLLTTFVQAWLSNKLEKKESYIGLLEAYHAAAVEHTDKAAKNFAYWQMRCELVAPKEVREVIQKIVDTNDNHKERIVAHEKLKEALRKDLGIDLSGH
jgi:ribulose bisphosphate carboxylase small subunit